MILMKVLQYWIRSDEPTNFPAITVDSIASRLILKVSSTSRTMEKCFFAFTMILLYFRYLIKLCGISLDAVFTVDANTILYFLCQISLFSLFYQKYNHTFVEKVHDLWNELQIELDYETRKYFWTHKVFYYSVTVFSKICTLIYDLGNVYYYWPYKDSDSLQSPFDYWTWVMRVPIIYSYYICHDFILCDLSIAAQTAIQNIESQLKRLYKESLKDERALHFTIIHDLRIKYLQTHRLVNKMNELMSPCLLVFLIIFTNYFIRMFYLILFVQQSRFVQMYQLSGCIGSFILIITIIHLTAQVYLKSQRLLMAAYKLSLKTDYLKVLNEITLFVNCNEIAFSLGGICMITSSAITTFFSILATLIIAIPSFG
uniref:Gustatory receptor n=1 Tax=Tetranychus urticae TaxID=32264 RepID=T1KIK3_TETUR